MAKLETVVKEAIARGARRQVRVLVPPLRRGRSTPAEGGEPRSTLTTLRRSAAGWKRLMDAAPAVPHVSEEEAKAARLSPRFVQRLRLGLSQTALARLMSVSAPAVAHWEAGNSTPTGRNRVTLVALRKVRKREVKELLARRVKETASRASHSRKRRTKRPRRR